MAVKKLQTVVNIELLFPNPWNTNIVSPDSEKRIEASITRLGVFKPVSVREVDGHYQILGGQHRWEAAKRLGHTTIPIFNVGVVEDARAKEIGLADNARYGEDDTLALSTLLKTLGTPDELMSFLPFSESDLTSIFSAESISLDNLGLPDGDEGPDLSATRAAPTHQLMRFKIPVEDVAWITSRIEQTMRKHNFTVDDSLTNAGNALVELIKEPSDTEYAS